MKLDLASGVDVEINMSNLELFGKKLGMTREFYTSGQSVPVTVLKLRKLEL